VKTNVYVDGFNLYRALKKSLFPDLLHDTVGEIHKPTSW
jgi:hypothetical protein